MEVCPPKPCPVLFAGGERAAAKNLPRISSESLPIVRESENHMNTKLRVYVYCSCAPQGGNRLPQRCAGPDARLADQGRTVASPRRSVDGAPLGVLSGTSANVLITRACCSSHRLFLLPNTAGWYFLLQDTPVRAGLPRPRPPAAKLRRLQPPLYPSAGPGAALATAPGASGATPPPTWGSPAAARRPPERTG